MRIRFAHLTDCLVGGLIIAAAVALMPRPALAQQRLGYPPGRGSYMRYCAVCHGKDAKGDGPYATLLKQKPANLTVLAKKNKGVFPTQRVIHSIYGREMIPAHGRPDMPVWGHRFAEASREAGSPVTGTIASERIHLIVQYLFKIQEK